MVLVLLKVSNFAEVLAIWSTDCFRSDVGHGSSLNDMGSFVILLEW